ncbi:hypothetical protein HBI56_057400 [Parastagonospora nodorum]|nr:hypothetical protein HBH53_150380 [Parastagonospora nodorum]KAH3966855.1 hypothetical protein HBH51_141800 [Parastagonospora nodorum]KAH4003193.1 hypothetical protein HBI10_070380 [Parastagonospora nodorum]KAH4027913.1 hypothetical protein HBI13_047640 [Parastagonospora nodorum]KAH4091834.1 hypothetical protein HBH46_183350 [Parastagonospora nodorum]
MPRQRPYGSTPQHGAYGGSASSIRSSPLPYYVEMPRRRQPSTNSGYFSRAELFGRASPTPLSFVPSSRALKRIEARRRNDYGMPNTETMASPLPGMSDSIEHTPSVGLSAQGLHAARASTFSSPDVRESLNTEAASFKTLRNNFSDLPKDEWMQAGAPNKQMTGSGIGPGPTLKSQVSFRFSSAVTNPEGKQSNGASESVNDVRRVSPAEEALRLTLSTVDHSRPSALKSRGSVRVSKLFKHQESMSTQLTTVVSPISDGKSSDIGHVEPSLPRESPPAILARAREREDAPQRDGELQADPTPDKSSNECVSSSMILNDRAISEDVDVGDNAANDSIALKSSDSSWLTYTPSIIDGHDSTSGIVATTDTSHRALVTQTPPAEETPVSSTRATFFELSQSNIPAAGHAPNFENESESAIPQELRLSSIMEVINQEPYSPAPPSMEFSLITELINQEPVILHSTSGLFFAAVSAITYGCVTIAAMRYALYNIGGSVRAVDLASEMVLAAMIGFIVCAILQFADGGQLRRLIDCVLRILGN